MTEPASLRLTERARPVLAAIRTRVTSREYALRALVAVAATAILGWLGPIAALGGVFVSQLVYESVEEAFQRSRLSRRKLWPLALLVFLLSHLRKTAATAVATAAAVTAAVAFVVTVPELIVGHSLVGGDRTTFFGGDTHHDDGGDGGGGVSR
jgi:hypothetical protein